MQGYTAPLEGPLKFIQISFEIVAYYNWLYPNVQALKNVNDALKRRDPEEEELFTVTLMSRNSAQVGIRLQKSIEHYEPEGKFLSLP